MSPSFLRNSIAFFLFCTFYPLGSADVLLVDPGGHGDFTDAQAAIDAAAEGDTIFLQRPTPFQGEYRFPPLAIQSKRLTLAAAPGVSMPAYSLVVTGLEQHQSVVVSNLWFSDLVVMHDNLGMVLLEDCSVEPFANSYPSAQAGCSVTDCARVVLDRCELSSGGTYGTDVAAAGLAALRSRVQLNECTITGGAGHVVCPYAPEPGGPGVWLESSSLRAEGCTLIGGKGGDDFNYCGVPGSDGGPGVLVSPGSSAVAIDSQLLGGEGGYSNMQVGMTGPASANVLELTNSYAPRLDVPTRGIESRTVPLALRGAPGDRVRIVIGQIIGPRPLGLLSGTLIPGGPLQIISVGTIPASGELNLDFAVPPVAPGSSSGLFMQAAFVAPNGSLRLSNVEHVVALDSDALPWIGKRAFVTASAATSGDGESWTTARADLRTLLREIPDSHDFPVEIWVAAGTYTPAPAQGDQDLSFDVYSGAQLFGGFVGNETALSQRDPIRNPTLLSGDLQGDGNGPGVNADNSFTVLAVGPESRIRQGRQTKGVRVDGFRIEGAHSQNTAVLGVGMILAGDVTVANCTVTDNGRGIRSFAEAARIVNCRVVANRRPGGQGGLGGGGITVERRPGFSDGDGATVISNCLIATNRMGGVVLIRSSGVRVVSCTIVNNRTTGVHPAGVMGTFSQVSNCIIWENRRNAGDPAGLAGQVSLGTGLAVDSSCVQGLGSTVLGLGNIDGDPGFVDPAGVGGWYGGPGSDLSLGASSPCADAGSNYLAPQDVGDLDGDGDVTEHMSIDLAGGRRFTDDPDVPDTGSGLGNLIDIGAFERPVQP